MPIVLQLLGFSCQFDDPSFPSSSPKVSSSGLETMGRVGMVGEDTQPLDGKDTEVGHAKAPVANHGAESLNNESKVEEAMPARRRTYRTCTVFSNYPLGSYDDDSQTLSRLGPPSLIGVEHVFVLASEPQALDVGAQGNRWVSPPSVITARVLDRIRKSGLVRGVQWAVLPLHPYFRDITAYFGMYPTQITSKGIKRTNHPLRWIVCHFIVLLEYLDSSLVGVLSRWLGLLVEFTMTKTKNLG
uniref:Uncharacterized protein n=1 Tax=Cannabis sativa TaxID=3483 RepID=A0A803PQ61_CANSA